MLLTVSGFWTIYSPARKADDAIVRWKGSAQRGAEGWMGDTSKKSFLVQPATTLKQHIMKKSKTSKWLPTNNGLNSYNSGFLYGVRTDTHGALQS